MTTRLKRALDEVAQLPSEEQDAVASWLLDELKAEHRWNEAFGRSEDVLSGMAADALAEHLSGKTTPLDPDTL